MTHHGRGLRRLTKNPALVRQLKKDWRRAPITPAEHAMLTYAEKLTITPGAMAKTDVMALRAAGFSDTAILDINQVTGYFAYVNRLADGLGVPLEEFWRTVDEDSDI